MSITLEIGEWYTRQNMNEFLLIVAEIDKMTISSTINLNCVYDRLLDHLSHIPSMSRIV